jgi:SAM-dependent methyltransferase
MSDQAARALLSRARAERDAAARRYNEALSALDLARQKFSAWPDSPRAYDEGQIAPLNRTWDILPSEGHPHARGWRGRLAGFVWNLIAPPLQRQRAFNAALVEHLNRNVAAHREAHEALQRALPALYQAFEGLAHFELLLLHFLQQVTPLDDARERMAMEAVEDLRHVVEVAQRAALTARRDVERLAAAAGTTPAAALPPTASTTTTGDAYKYVGFEDRFRGSEADIRARLADYVPHFAGAVDVLDVGCGRGEFLDLLREAGIDARGLDLNPEMVETCRARGLSAETGDALEYLRRQPDGSLGGLIAVQVIEHLEPGYLGAVLQAAFDKLRPGAPIVLETINPACWVAFFESYIRDLTHVRPVHPETLQYLLHASGFSGVEIVFRAPIAEEARLERVSPRAEHVGFAAPHDPVTELVGAFNRNMDRLNARMFTFQDYAAIGRRT